MMAPQAWSLTFFKREMMTKKNLAATVVGCVLAIAVGLLVGACAPARHCDPDQVDLGYACYHATDAGDAGADSDDGGSD